MNSKSNTPPQLQAMASFPRPWHDDYLDVRDAAAQRGLGFAEVWIERTLLDYYSEIRQSLGHNIVGVILDMLSVRPVRDGEPFLVCLRRRQDDSEAEVVLHADLKSEGSVLLISLGGERESQIN